MNRRYLIAALALVVLVGLAVSGWLVGRATRHGAEAHGTPTSTPSVSSSPTAPTPTSTASPETSTPTPTPVTTVSAEEIKQASTTLENAPAQPQAAVAPEAIELYGVDLSEVFPPGTKITVDQDSWTDVDATTAMVATTITRPGAEPERYTAVLGKTAGEWKLLGTLPLEEETP